MDIRKKTVFLRKYLKLVAGIEIRPKGKLRTDLIDACSHLREVGFTPKTVVDVGVGYGTHEIYDFWPTANILLIEPIEEFKPELDKIARSYENVYYEIAAASNKNGKVTINVSDGLSASSLLKQKDSSNDSNEVRTVPAITVDDLCKTNNLDGPYLLKVVVQGAELIVLDGAKRTLDKTEVAIIYTAFFESYQNRPLLYDVVKYMKSKGFVAYDIVRLVYRPYDNALNTMFLIFVKETSPFRKYVGYK